MPLIDREQLGPQFRFWAVHVTLTAAPSFVIALIAFNTVVAVTAMLAGIATFVLGYSLLCASTLYVKMSRESTLGRAVKIGTRIRMMVSLVTAPLLLSHYLGFNLVLLAPDFWAGWGAMLAVEQGWLLVAGERLHLDEGTPASFLPTYCVVIVEGLIISFTLVLLVFFTLLVLNRKAVRVGGDGMR